MKKKTILLITIIMSIFMLVGCTDKEDKYNKDNENLKKIIRLNNLVEDTYAKARDIETEEIRGEFSDYCDKIVKEAKKIDVKIKEGKELKNLYIEKIEYSRDYLINNWNDTSKPLTQDEGLGKIEGEITTLANRFLNKKEQVVYDKMEKSSRFDILYFAFGIVVGTAGFALLNKKMTVYYGGVKGMFLTWVTCVCIGTFVIAPLVGEVLIWVIGIGSAVIAYKAIKNRNESTIEE